MRLDQLIAGLSLRVTQGNAQLDVDDLTDDSRQVTPGSLFIARTGADADGRAFIADAIARGAGAVLAASPLPADVPGHVTLLSADHVDQGLAGTLASRLFGHPHEKLRLIGITGTNGKTTTAWIVRHLLHAAGVRCGLIGTVMVDEGGGAAISDLGFRISDLHKPTGAGSKSGIPNPKSEIRNPKFEIPANTTPGSIAFVRLLARMVANGCEAAVAEVSSHALHQGRADALRFDAAVFTNLTGDHLDYHQTMDAYADAKARLFRLLKPAGWAIVNADDARADAMLAAAPAAARVLRCHRQQAERASAPAADAPHAFATIRHASAEGSDARFVGPWGSVDAMLPLVGPHNVTNTLQAIAAAFAVCEGVTPTLPDALPACPPVPGRLERVSGFSFQVSGSSERPRNAKPETSNQQPETPTVLVDYAHTDDALDNVLRALRPLTAGRLIVLFGCGGDRDRTKRPKMARTAQQWADLVFVTSDNPRTEDPQRIIDDITAGFTALKPEQQPDCPSPSIHIEPDRAKAIRAAIATAAVGDTVLLAGKGHEDYQIIEKDKRHFDDREHAAAALAAWQAGGAASSVPPSRT